MSDIIDPGHFKELAALDPQDVCRRARCEYDEKSKSYTLNVWGVLYQICPDKGVISCGDNSDATNQMLALFAIHYLLTCVESMPSGNWISEKDMVGGVTFFRGPHEIPTRHITRQVNDSIENFKKLCESMNGSPLSMGDAAYSFQITDRIPVAVLFWEGDEDFPAETKLLYDSTLPNHFALDIVYALAVGICDRLGSSPLPATENV